MLTELAIRIPALKRGPLLAAGPHPLPVAARQTRATLYNSAPVASLSASRSMNLATNVPDKRGRFCAARFQPDLIALILAHVRSAPRLSW